jgi:hypothetical protein
VKLFASSPVFSWPVPDVSISAPVIRDASFDNLSKPPVFDPESHRADFMIFRTGLSPRKAGGFERDVATLPLFGGSSLGSLP